jgi:histone-binding protein RBBP4
MEKEFALPIRPNPQHGVRLANSHYTVATRQEDVITELHFFRPTFSDADRLPDSPLSTHRLLIGTHTSNGAQNYLEIAHVQLPNANNKPDINDYDAETGEIGGYGGGPSKKAPPQVTFTVVQKIDHPGEVNKARYQPQNPDVIATMCTDGRVMIWNRTHHSSLPTGQIKPDIELYGHEKEGFGLSWSLHEAGHLASGSEDKTVRLWDITHVTKTNRLLHATRTYTHHTAIVNDVQYHPIHKPLLGTVSDDLTMKILDTRSPENSKSALTSGEGQHTDAVNAIAFNPAHDTLVATGSADNTIGIWDLRRLKEKMHVLQGHNASVTSLAWHPFNEAILGSSSYDRRIMFWDLNKIGEEQTPEESQDGPPELLFIHGGHTNRISDFSWNQNDPWVVCSAAEDNLIQVWKPARGVLEDDDEENVPMDELES